MLPQPPGKVTKLTFQMRNLKMSQVTAKHIKMSLSLKLALILGIMCFPVYSTWSKTAKPKTSSTVEFKHKRYYVDYIVRINSSPERVIHSLTDYKNLHNIIPSVSNARLLEIHSNYDLVETTLYSCVLFFCKKIINVQQIMIIDNTITARTIPNKSDFKYGIMTWKVEERAGITTLKYHAEFEFKFWMPPFIGQSYLMHKLKKEADLLSRGLENI